MKHLKFPIKRNCPLLTFTDGLRAFNYENHIGYLLRLASELETNPGNNFLKISNNLIRLFLGCIIMFKMHRWSGHHWNIFKKLSFLKLTAMTKHSRKSLHRLIFLTDYLMNSAIKNFINNRNREKKLHWTWPLRVFYKIDMWMSLIKTGALPPKWPLIDSILLKERNFFEKNSSSFLIFLALCLIKESFFSFFFSSFSIQIRFCGFPNIFIIWITIKIPKNKFFKWIFSVNHMEIIWILVWK